MSEYEYETQTTRLMWIVNEKWKIIQASLI